MAAYYSVMSRQLGVSDIAFLVEHLGVSDIAFLVEHYIMQCERSILSVSLSVDSKTDLSLSRCG